MAVWYAAYARSVPRLALVADEANVAGAIEWAHAHNEPEAVAALCDAMRSFWNYLDRTAASLRYLPWGIAAAQTGAPSGDRESKLREARLCSFYGSALRIIGKIDDAETYYQQSLAIRREVQDRRGEGVDLYSLALIAEARGDLDRAEALHRESLAIGVEVQNGPDVADSLLALGRFLIEHQRNPDEGCQMLRDAVRLYAEMGLPGLANAVEAALRFGCMSIEDLRQFGIEVRQGDESEDAPEDE